MLELDLIQTGLYPILFGKQPLENHSKPVTEDLKIYAIVDGAKLRTVYNKLEKSKPPPPHKMLYTGSMADELEAVAPYLIELSQHDEFTNWLLINGYAQHCLCFIKSPATLADLATHFRDYALVTLEQDHDEEPALAFYAFYDPRVFPSHMYGMTSAETALFFEPLSSCWCEDRRQPKSLIGYYPGTVHKCSRVTVHLEEVSKRYKIKQQAKAKRN